MDEYFTDWPFNITAPDKPTFVADRKKEKEQMEKIFKNFLRRQNSSFYCLAGMFGSGKSHFLKYFQNQLVNDENSFFLYTPSFITDVKNFKDFYVKTLADFFSSPVFLVEIKSIWKDCVKKLGVKDARNFLLTEISRNWIDFANVLIILLEWVNYDDVQELMNSQEFYLTSSWLKGIKLSKKERTFIKIRRNVETDEDAVKVVTSFIKFLTTNHSEKSRKGFIWAIDDCHFIKDINKRNREQILRGFKLCIDENVKNYLFIMSFAVHTKNEVDLYLIGDLIDRRKNDSIFLPQLNEDEAVTYIKDVINNYDRHKNEGLYPFNEESIKLTINIICKRDPIITPRKLHMKIGNIIQKAQDEIFPNVISVGYIKKYYEEINDE